MHMALRYEFFLVVGNIYEKHESCNVLSKFNAMKKLISNYRVVNSSLCPN